MHSDTTDAYERKLVGIVDQFKPRIVRVMDAIRNTFKVAGWTIVSEPAEMGGDDYRWSMVVRKPGVGSLTYEPGEGDVDITLGIAEQAAHDGEGGGITFVLDIVEYGGRILGGLSPFNYTEKVWVALDDALGLDERFSYFENADPIECVAVAMT